MPKGLTRSGWGALARENCRIAGRAGVKAPRATVASVAYSIFDPCGAGVRVNAMAALENAVDRSGGGDENLRIGLLLALTLVVA